MSKLAVPPEVLAQHTAILGKTGSGKSSTAKLCVEQVVAAGSRVCILDPIKSDWWGITSSGDGRKPGLPFRILGGPRGHVGLHSSAGKAIGQLVGEGKLPLSIIDMADFEPGGVQKFFSDFAPALMRHAKGVLYLVIEEAHEMAPKERAGFGAENMAIHWAKKLATAGRSKGIRLIVATQRVQSLHNAVLGSCETLIAHRLSTPPDQKPIQTWLASNADKATAAKVEQSLSSLPTGTGWLCSGEARIFEKIAFPKFSTYDNAKTPTGDDDVREVKTAPVDSAELRSIIGDAVAEAEANDPKRLKAQIADLKKQLGGKAPVVSTTQPDAEALRAAEARGKVTGFDDGRRVGYAEGEKAALTRVADAVAGVKAGDATLTALPKRPAVAPPQAQPAPVRNMPKPIAGSAAETNLNGAQRKILAALGWWSALGHQQPTRVMVASIAGFSPTASHFGNMVSALKGMGLVGYPPTAGLLELTDAGVAVAEVPDIGRARDAVRPRLNGAQQKIFDVLIRGGDMDRNDVAEQAGFSATASHFGNMVSSLKTLGVIEYPAKGVLRISSWLFDEAA